MKIQLLSLLILSVFSIATSHAELAFQDHESIQNAAKSFILNNLESASEYTVKIAAMDNRLKLPLCSQPLQSFSKHGSIKNGRNSIGVRCDTGKKWSLYISATIAFYKEVYVLAKPLARGQLITEAHLGKAKIQQSKLRRGYLTDFSLIKNKLATRHLSVGSIIDPSHFVEPKIIKRGQKVIISANSPYFDIRMPGQAMMDATKGQIINVRNLKSKRMIQATAVKPGLVSVIF